MATLNETTYLAIRFIRLKEWNIQRRNQNYKKKINKIKHINGAQPTHEFLCIIMVKRRQKIGAWRLLDLHKFWKIYLFCIFPFNVCWYLQHNSNWSINILFIYIMGTHPNGKINITSMLTSSTIRRNDFVTFFFSLLFTFGGCVPVISHRRMVIVEKKGLLMVENTLW